jgi:hypothetical protein
MEVNIYKIYNSRRIAVMYTNRCGKSSNNMVKMWMRRYVYKAANGTREEDEIEEYRIVKMAYKNVRRQDD